MSKETQFRIGDKVRIHMHDLIGTKKTFIQPTPDEVGLVGVITHINDYYANLYHDVALKVEGYDFEVEVDTCFLTLEIPKVEVGDTVLIGSVNRCSATLDSHAQPAGSLVGSLGQVLEVDYDFEDEEYPEAYVFVPGHTPKYIEVCYLTVVEKQKFEQTAPVRLSPQCSLLLQHMQKGHSLTQRSALLDFGVMALPRRIADLKEKGYPVQAVMETNKLTGQRYARYSLATQGE